MRAALCLSFLLTLVCPAAAQLYETRIFQLYHRGAEETVEMIAPLLSAQGYVLPEPRLQKLFVRDTPERLEAVERRLAELDRAAPHVRITVGMQGRSKATGQVLSLGPKGATVLADQGRSRVDAQQTLLVMSGEQGMIMMARELVSVAPYLRFCQRHSLLPAGLVVRSVSTGFAVEPTVVGEIVRLRITPWLSFVGGTGRVEVLADGASTVLAVKSGQETVIADSDSGHDFQSEAFGLILRSPAHAVERSTSISVRPEIVSL